MIDSPEKASSNKALDNSQPTGWEGVAAMANKYPTKETLLKSIENFNKETWAYKDIDNDEFSTDIKYIDALENEIKEGDSAESLKLLSNRLELSMGLMRFKYGFESEIICNNPSLANLQKTLKDIRLVNENNSDQYAEILAEYESFVNQNQDTSFINNCYEGVHGKERLYLAVESLKSLISNSEYRQLLNSDQIEEVYVDCAKMNRGVHIQGIESKYKDIIKQIWKQSLSNTVDENGRFRMLFSNISSATLKEQADLLLNRPAQSSCSMISSDFIATYNGQTNRIGFVYPNDSEILLASAYDLGSNVFSSGVKNREKGTTLATPEAIEKIGIARAKEKGDDLHSSSQYSEILVSSKPCGLLMIGLGEGDINIFYDDAKKLSLDTGLPMQSLDAMNYQKSLSEADKYYIAFHSIASYLGYSPVDLLHTDDNHDDLGSFYRSINIYKDKITDIFLLLKRDGKLNKKNMCEALSQIVSQKT